VVDDEESRHAAIVACAGLPSPAVRSLSHWPGVPQLVVLGLGVFFDWVDAGSDLGEWEGGVVLDFRAVSRGRVSGSGSVAGACLVYEPERR
jgi:hypothetical protein